MRKHCYIPRLEDEGVTLVYPYLSVLPSVTNIFHYIFHSNHNTRPLEARYRASSRGPSCGVPNSGLPVNFLFLDFVHFWTLHLSIVGVYSVSEQ